MEQVRFITEKDLRDCELTQKEHQMVEGTYEFARNFLRGAKEQGNQVMGGHLLDHYLRVAGMSVNIARGEATRIFPPMVTALLIDLGRHTNDPGSKSYKHGEVSMEIATPFLKTLGLPSDELDDILFSIRDHSKLNQFVEKPTATIQIVQDADRLMTLGALSPLRAAATRPNLPLIRPEDVLESLSSSTVDEEIKSVWIDMANRHMEWYDLMWTYTGKRIAKERREFQIAYLNQLRFDVRPVYETIADLKLPLSLE